LRTPGTVEANLRKIAHALDEQAPGILSTDAQVPFSRAVAEVCGCA
jgi:hypothetical protein